jgi:hypothetical protein
MEVRTMVPAFPEKFIAADEATRSQYFAKIKSEGELAAMRWLVNGK